MQGTDINYTTADRHYKKNQTGTIYITFIDYQKAYDKVNRRKLIEKLVSKGCGTKFLMSMTIGNKRFEISSGVKQ